MNSGREVPGNNKSNKVVDWIVDLEYFQGKMMMFRKRPMRTGGDAGCPVEALRLASESPRCDKKSIFCAVSISG